VRVVPTYPLLMGVKFRHGGREMFLRAKVREKGHCLPGRWIVGPIGQRTLTRVFEYTVNRETRQI
jgi:hypothetical protein